MFQNLWQNRFSFGLEDDSYFRLDKKSKQRYLILAIRVVNM